MIGKFLSKTTFKGSKNYWEHNYEKGGNSGEGSYESFAMQKGMLINDFIREHNIKRIIEFGCGDGNQLSYYNLDGIHYYGFDISKKAVELCREKHKHYVNKEFFILDERYIVPEQKNAVCDLALSMDVIFHLVEDTVFFEHLDSLFNSSKKYVMIFGININKIKDEPSHVRHRAFVPIILERFPDWKLQKIIKSKIIDERFTMFPDMHIFERTQP